MVSSSPRQGLLVLSSIRLGYWSRRRRLGPGRQGNELVHGHLLSLWLVQEDIVGVHHDGLPMEDTVEVLPILDDNLGWTFPVTLMVPFEVDPVSSLNSARISVDSLFQSLPDRSVGLGGGEGFPGGHLHAVVSGPCSLAVRYLLVGSWIVFHKTGMLGKSPEHELEGSETVNILE